MTIACLVRQRSRDRGNALLIAVMVTSVCLSLLLVGVVMGVSSSRSSGVDRQRVLAVYAAEAGVDGGYTAIQAAGVNLPCTLASGDVHAAPDTASYTTAVTYFDASGAKLNTCPPVGPVQALIRSTATTNSLGGSGSKPTRVVEALVNLTSVGGGGGGAGPLNKAMFADNTLKMADNMVVKGNAGANADLYSNTSAYCAAGSNVAGTITSQVDFFGYSGCLVGASVWAGRNVTTDNNAITGFVKAGTGTILAGTGTTVSGNLYAAGSITYASCGAGKCFPNSSPGNPTALAFPQIPSDDASLTKWTAAGYTVYDDNASCFSLYQKIRDTYAKTGTKTLVRTTCQVLFAADTAVVLSNDLAIFAKGGIQIGSGNTWSSNSATKRNVHLIVPYDAAGSRPCFSPSLLMNTAGVTMSSAVWLFAYSPCQIGFSGLGTINGQIYGGSDVNTSLGFTLQYQSVPTYGIANAASAPTGYTTGIVYKRETR